jgi:hypothetical protein
MLPITAAVLLAFVSLDPTEVERARLLQVNLEAELTCYPAPAIVNGWIKFFEVRKGRLDQGKTPSAFNDSVYVHY